jgi:uncharacterized membrane protein SirB2
MEVCTVNLQYSYLLAIGISRFVGNSKWIATKMLHNVSYIANNKVLLNVGRNY